jgi:hypothetical protein
MLNVSTTACRHTQTPAFFTSLGTADDSGSGVLGVNSIYNAGATGFRVYINKSGGITPAQANANKWVINWRAMPIVSNFEGRCVGTTEGSTSWVQSGTNVIYTDVSTACAPPIHFLNSKYFISLGGTSSHYTTQGTSAVHFAISTGFRVYLNKSGLTPAYANARNWQIDWHALPNLACSSTAVSPSWTQFATNVVSTFVNTSGCPMNDDRPRLFTALTGHAEPPPRSHARCNVSLTRLTRPSCRTTSSAGC